MAISHTIIDIDTLPALALTYLNDSSRWKEIADYNKLSYPYIVADKTDLENLFGSGYLTITRTNYQNSTVIKAGWQFKTKPIALAGGVIKVVEVVEDTYIPAGTATAYIRCRCTVIGSYGNITEYLITDMGDNTAELSNIQFTSIYNENKFIGGKDATVKLTGDIIYIPTDSSEVIPESIEKIAELIGGSDLLIDDNGDLSIGGGDLISVSGEDNIQRAVLSRLMSEVDEYILHPEYGTELDSLIGATMLNSREKLMGVYIRKALSNENRISNVEVNTIVIQSTSIYIDISYVIVTSGVTQRIAVNKAT